MQYITHIALDSVKRHIKCLIVIYILVPKGRKKSGTKNVLCIPVLKAKDQVLSA